MGSDKYEHRSPSPGVPLYLCQAQSKHYDRVGLHIPVHLYLFYIICARELFFFFVCVCWKWQVPDSHIAALEKLRGPSWPCFYWPPHHVYLHQLAEWETCNGCPCRNQVQVLWLSEGDSHLKTWNFTKFNADEFKNLVAKKWSTPNGYEINNYIHGPLGIWWICEGFPSPLNMFTNKFPF